MKLALILVAILGAQADGSRLAVPDRAAQAAAERLIDAVYGEKLKAAKTPEAKSKLAREILEVVKEEPDAANKYVGLQTVKRLAVEAEDGALGLETVKVLAATFASETGADAETLIRQAEALWEAAERKRGTDQLAGRLEAVELWLRAGSTSPLVAKKWEERINGLAPAAEIVLHAKDAKIVGTTLRYDRRTDLTLHWRTPTDYLEWEKSIPSGIYSVRLVYSADKDMSWGSILAISVFAEGNRRIASSIGTFQPTGQWGTTGTVEFPAIRIPASGQVIVRLHVVRARPNRQNRGIISFREAILRRQ